MMAHDEARLSKWNGRVSNWRPVGLSPPPGFKLVAGPAPFVVPFLADAAYGRGPIGSRS